MAACKPFLRFPILYLLETQNYKSTHIYRLYLIVVRC